MSDHDREHLASALKRAFAALQVERVEPPSASNTTAITAATMTDGRAVDGSISFTLPLLKAVLAGHKTQTRRPVRPVPATVEVGIARLADGSAIDPPVRASHRLWVREKWARDESGAFVYAADDATLRVRWIASRFMPRAAARHFVRVEKVSIARLSAIDEADVLAEGAAADASAVMYGPLAWFIGAWDAIYGGGEYASANDPWVWVLTFARVRSSADPAAIR